MHLELTGGCHPTTRVQQDVIELKPMGGNKHINEWFSPYPQETVKVMGM